MSKEQRFIYDEVVKHGGHTLTEAGFNLLFPTEESVIDFLRECLAIEGLEVKWQEPRTFTVKILPIGAD